MFISLCLGCLDFTNSEAVGWWTERLERLRQNVTKIFYFFYQQRNCWVLDLEMGKLRQNATNSHMFYSRKNPVHAFQKNKNILQSQKWCERTKMFKIFLNFSYLEDMNSYSSTKNLLQMMPGIFWLPCSGHLNQHLWVLFEPPPGCKFCPLQPRPACRPRGNEFCPAVEHQSGGTRVQTFEKLAKCFQTF